MTIYDFLKKPAKSVVSLGQALTNACDMNCPHCYSRFYQNGKIGVKECESILRALPNVRKINFGTGETYLNPNFLKIFQFYRENNIQLALTTNGNTLARMTDKEIKDFLSEVDVSLDFPQAKSHDAWRKAGSFAVAMLQIERAKKLGIDASIALALTRANYSYLPKFAKILDKYKVILRVNVYKPVHEKSFALSCDEFWKSIKLIADNFYLVGCSEPILSLIIGKKVRSSPCGDSFRVHADLSVSGCVYLSNKIIETENFLNLKSKTPRFCRNCKVVKICRGGCLSRRILQADAMGPDPYCPMAKGEDVPKIKMKLGPVKNLVHLDYLCTFLLSR